MYLFWIYYIAYQYSTTSNVLLVDYKGLDESYLNDNIALHHKRLWALALTEIAHYFIIIPIAYLSFIKPHITTYTSLPVPSS